MTLGEVKEKYKNQYAEIQIFSTNLSGKDYPKTFCKDNCNFINIDEDEELYWYFYANNSIDIGLVELMDCERYNCFIDDYYVNFRDRYGLNYNSKKAKILCLMVKR